MGELEIASFAANLRADQESRTGFLCKPGGIPISLHQCQPFMEYGQFDVQFLPQGGRNGLDLALAAANEQRLFLIQ